MNQMQFASETNPAGGSVVSALCPHQQPTHDIAIRQREGPGSQPNINSFSERRWLRERAHRLCLPFDADRTDRVLGILPRVPQSIDPFFKPEITPAMRILFFAVQPTRTRLVPHHTAEDAPLARINLIENSHKFCSIAKQTVAQAKFYLNQC